MNKVKLEVNKRDHGDNKSLPVVTMALPFFKSNQPNTKYFHRVRSVTNHKLKGSRMHTGVSLWCGQSGFISNGRGKLYKEADGVRCTVCEGKAIGSGVDGARIINGKKVNYSPRDIKPETVK